MIEKPQGRKAKTNLITSLLYKQDRFVCLPMLTNSLSQTFTVKGKPNTHFKSYILLLVKTNPKECGIFIWTCVNE